MIGDDEGREERLEELREHSAIFGAALRCAVGAAPTFRCAAAAKWVEVISQFEVEELA